MYVCVSDTCSCHDKKGKSTIQQILSTQLYRSLISNIVLKVERVTPLRPQKKQQQQQQQQTNKQKTERILRYRYGH